MKAKDYKTDGSQDHLYLIFFKVKAYIAQILRGKNVKLILPLTTLFILFCFAPAEAEGQVTPHLPPPGYIANSGFEEQLNGWSTRSPEPNSVIEATKRTFHSGDYSAQAKLAGASQDVTTKLTPGKQYKLSGWIKTEGITAGPGAAIFLFFTDEEGNSKQEWQIATIGKVKGTTVWTYYEDSFYLPEMPGDADTIQVGFGHEGEGVAWFDDLVLIGEGNPIAKFDYSPMYPSVGETVTFNASDSFDPDGKIVSWHWDFGDGSTSSEKNPTHTYSRPGSYPVNLKVTDDDQKIDWTGTEVTVIEETRFKGTALKFKQTAADGISWWIVEVEEVLSGPSISGKIPVSYRAENCRGYVDENIESGDKVEVFGHYVNYFLFDAGFAESVKICSSRDYYIREKGKAKYQVAIRVKNNDDESHSVDIYIDKNLVKKNFSVPSGNDFRVDFYEVEEGKHTFNVKWTDEGKNYENPVEMEITSDTSITLKVRQYPKGAYLNFQISNADDDDHPHVYIYIDGDKKGFVSVPSGKTRKSKNFRVEPGRHKVTIEWEGKKEQYSRSKDVFVQLGETEVVLFQISTTALVEVRVIDDDGDRVKNAEVQIGRKEKRTNVTGFALFTIEEGTYYAVVTKPGYAIPKKSITLHGGEKESIGFTLIPINIRSQIYKKASELRRANESFKRVTTSFHNSVYHIFVYYEGDITQISKIVVFNSKGKILKPEKTPLEIFYAPFLFSALEIRSWKEKGKSLKGEYFFKQERNYARFEKDFDQIAWEMEKIAKKLEHALEVNTAAINIASFVSSVYSFYAKLGPIAMKQILKEVLKEALQSASEETLMNLLKEKMSQEVIKKVGVISDCLENISKLFDGYSDRWRDLRKFGNSYKGSYSAIQDILPTKEGLPAKFLLEAITLYEKFYELGETIGAAAEDLGKIGKVIKKLRQYRGNLISKSEIKTILNQYKSKQFFPSEKPKADFKWSPPKPEVNQVVQFTDKAYDPDGKIVKWQWDFGDGSTSTQQNPSHKYSSPGTYEVCLTVTDNDQAKATTCHDIPVISPNISAEVNFDHLSDKNPDVGDTLTMHATVKNTGNAKYRFVVGMSIGKKGQTTWHDTDIYNDPNNSKLCKIPDQPDNAYVCIKLDPGEKGSVYRKFFLDPSKNPKEWSDIWIAVKDKDLDILDQEFVYDAFLVGSITEKASIKRAGPQNPAEVSFTKSRVIQLKLEVNKPVQDETVSVRETATGEIKQDPPGLVYRFIDLESTIADENINSVTLTFKLSKNWLQRVNSARNEVAIQKFDPVIGEWRKLSTRFVEESGNDLIFKATSKGLSTYAITSTAQLPGPDWSKSGILPSPVTESTATLHIEGQQFNQVTLMIFTLSYPAQKVFEGTYYTNDAIVDLSLLDNGVYLYVLIVQKDGNTSKSPVKKLLVQR